MIRDDIRRDVCHVMAVELERLLPLVGGEHWWKWYVLQQLTDAQRDLHKNVSENDIFELDMAALLRVFYRNWSELAAKGYLPRGQGWVVGKMIDSRNRWAHEPARGAAVDELLRDFAATEQFLTLIKADRSLIRRVGLYKDKLETKLRQSPCVPQSRSSETVAPANIHPFSTVGADIRPVDEESAAIGVIQGITNAATETIRGSSGWLIPESELKNQATLLRMQSDEYKRLVTSRQLRLNAAIQKLDRLVVLDTVLVGGETLAAYIIDGHIPDDVLHAYELAYPNEAAAMTFTEKVNQMDVAQLVGLSSGIKGKVFEIQYVDYLNSGNLPEGFTAELAPSANNPGSDIAIHGPDGDLADTIQLKATESVGYVKEALDRYPDIDVVTTHEVYGHLVMQGLGESVADSGISDSALNDLIDGAVVNATPHIDFGPSPISAALIAFSVYTQDGLSAFQRAHQLGSRGTKSYLAYLAGNTISVLTNTWWLGLFGGMGSRLLLEVGRKKDSDLTRLKILVESNAKILARLRGPLTGSYRV